MGVELSQIYAHPHHLHILWWVDYRHTSHWAGQAVLLSPSSRILELAPGSQPKESSWHSSYNATGANAESDCRKIAPPSLMAKHFARWHAFKHIVKMSYWGRISHDSAVSESSMRYRSFWACEVMSARLKDEEPGGRSLWVSPTPFLIYNSNQHVPLSLRSLQQTMSHHRQRIDIQVLLLVLLALLFDSTNHI